MENTTLGAIGAKTSRRRASSCGVSAADATSCSAPGRKRSQSSTALSSAGWRYLTSAAARARLSMFVRLRGVIASAPVGAGSIASMLSSVSQARPPPSKLSEASRSGMSVGTSSSRSISRSELSLVSLFAKSALASTSPVEDRRKRIFASGEPVLPWPRTRTRRPRDRTGSSMRVSLVSEPDSREIRSEPRSISNVAPRAADAETVQFFSSRGSDEKSSRSTASLRASCGSGAAWPQLSASKVARIASSLNDDLPCSYACLAGSYTSS